MGGHETGEGARSKTGGHRPPALGLKPPLVCREGNVYISAANITLTGAAKGARTCAIK